MGKPSVYDGGSGKGREGGSDFSLRKKKGLPEKARLGVMMGEGTRVEPVSEEKEESGRKSSTHL